MICDDCLRDRQGTAWSPVNRRWLCNPCFVVRTKAREWPAYYENPRPVGVLLGGAL